MLLHIEWLNSEIYHTPIPTNQLVLNLFGISNKMLQTIVHMSAHLTQELDFGGCNIETKSLEFNSEIKFTLPRITFNDCYGYNGESSQLNEELEDIVEAISTSDLKNSLKKFWFSDRDNSITKEDTQVALENKGLDNIIVERE